jgi:cephalosporin-C deacetylase
MDEVTGERMREERIDAFWSETLRVAAEVPLEATREVADAWHPYAMFNISYRSWGGSVVRGKMGVPINPIRTPLPAIISGPGYGGWQQPVDLAECQRGFVVLQIFPRDQGISGPGPIGQPRSGPEPLLIGIDSPENFYYRGAYVDMIRGVDFLAACPEVDPGRIGAMATSQGGALVLAAGALDPRIKAVCAHVPFFCDMPNNDFFKKRNHEICRRQELFAYFDPAVLASRCHAPTLLSSGGNDETCPANTIQTVFTRLPGVKAIVHYPKLTHTSSGDFHGLQWNWMSRYL